MATCDNIAVDLAPIDFDVTICSTPAFDVEIIQPDVTLEAISIAGQGPKGDQGDQGDQGVPGTPGAAGAPGSPGIAASVDVGTTTTGAPGSAANVVNSGTNSTAIFDFTIPRGDVGATGPMGQGILIKGSVPNHAALPATGNTPGDVWVTSDTAHGWAWTGTAWVDIGPIQGPPGAVGPSGPAGSDGVAGAPGAAATATAGTTTTGAPGTAANVVNTGTSSAAVFAFTIPRGDVGATGAAGTPGGAGSPGAPGAPGVAGANAWTLVTNASFTVPAYGANVTVQAGDTSWVALGEWIYVDDAGGLGVAGQLVVTSKTPTTLTLFNPTPTTYPLASTSTDGLLRKVSGLTTDFVDGTNNCQALTPQITSVRLRSYNSAGNPTFEVDQRVTGGSGITNPGLNVFVIDRWQNSKNISGALAYSAGQSNAPTAPVILPGTNFRLSNSCLFISLNTQQTTLAAGEVALLNQFVESPMLRELISDVHSLSVLAYTNVSGGLKFSLSLRDPATTHSLVKLCTVTTSGVWQLIQMPNIPLWNAAGNWGTTPGTVGYQLGICFAAGANFLTAPDVWANGNFVGATGMDNLGSKPVGSYLLIGFVQHEPGPLCTTLMDKSFSQNLDECLRYYCKSYDYDVRSGTITYAGVCSGIAYSTGFVRGGTRYPVPMAKIPTVTTWTPNNATAGAALDDSTGVLVGCSPSDVGKAGLGSLNNGSAGFIAGREYSFHYTADTGW